MSELNSSQMLPVDNMLDGRYRIVRYLASGGFGNTYVAEDTRLNCRVAIKEFFMRGTNHRSADHTTVEVSNAENSEGFFTQLEKFRREARRIFNINNEHIIHVSDMFDSNGTSYYVMDLIDGESLKDRLSHHLLTEAEVRNVADQLFDALDAVHKAGFFHLDVKPGNIMIDKNDHCTLIDFGASKQMSSIERTSLSASGMAYTPGYAPVEQESQRTRSIGPWTDIYAVGATFYNLLTRQKPPEIDAFDIAANSRMFTYPLEISQQMRHAIFHMMSPDYRKRPQNVEEAKALLSDCSGEDTITLTSSTGSLESINHSEQTIDSSETLMHNGTRAESSISEHKGNSLKSIEKQSKKKHNKLWIYLFTTLSVILCIACLYYFILRSSESNETYNASSPNEIAEVDDSDSSYLTYNNTIIDENIEVANSLNEAFHYTSWSQTEFGFKVPDIMTYTPEEWIEELSASVYSWNYEDVSMCYCPLMGNWATTDYPAAGSLISDNIKIKSVTYQDSKRSVYSGYTDDGRIWYMKKRNSSGGVVSHASFLAVIYPKSMQKDSDKFINTVSNY